MSKLSDLGAAKVDVRGYETDPMFALASEYVNATRAIKEETNCDFVNNPSDALTNEFALDELKRGFVENSYDVKDPRFEDEGFRQSHLENMEQLFNNDRVGMLQEATNTSITGYNPVIGMSLPMHKNILMNAIFDQVMPKDVASSPKFTLTMETRTIVDTQGREYDMFVEQNHIKPAIDESIPSADIVVTYPFMGTINPVAILNEDGSPKLKADGSGKAEIKELSDKTDGNIVKRCFDDIIHAYAKGNAAHLSIKTYVSKLLIKGYAHVGDPIYKDGAIVAATEDGDGQTLVFNIGATFTPGYGENDRQLNKRIAIRVPQENGEFKVYSINLNGQMIAKNDEIELLMTQPIDVTTPSNKQLVDGDGLIIGAVIHAVIDVSSAAFPTVHVKWSATTNFYEIPEAPHITIPVTPEEVKDIQALYNINQVTKLMSMLRLALLHWKDDSILQDLDDSFLSMPDNAKVTGAFDFAPPLNYNQDPVTWRRAMFMDNFSLYATRMLNVLNDENMTFAIFGRPEIIKRIAPVDFTYQTPSNIGPVQLDFKRTVVSSDHRVYNFISSQKMRNDNTLIILLIPRNSMRITYKIIDYQMYISNEIRDSQQYQLPAITCFERWYFLQYQPVQGRIRIMNPSGLRENISLKSENDYIGERGARNDDTANTEQFATEVNGVIDPETSHMKVPPVTTTGG